MIKNFIYFFAIILFATSCNSKVERQKKTCISNELQQCIKDYIKENEYKIAIYDGETNELIDDIYYSLLFFNINSAEYFTIWESYVPASRPVFSVESPKLDTNFLYYNVEERNVYVINYTGDSNNLLFSYCAENIQLGKEKQRDNDFPIYDGSNYPATYKYYKKKDKIVIEKLDTVILEW